MIRRILATLLLTLIALGAGAQIVNRIGADKKTFQRYASGRMQPYEESNLVLADSLYKAGVEESNYRKRCLALTLEFPVRYARGEYDRMDECVAEIKESLMKHEEARDHMYSVIDEYCRYLIHIGRASDAMLEARAMQRLSGEENNPLGAMYAYRIMGLIQSERTNSHLAIEYFGKAAQYSKEASVEQELPNLYILIAQEYIRSGEYPSALDYCNRAREYVSFFPALAIKVEMTMAYYYYAQGRTDDFMASYEKLVNHPLYKVQTEKDERLEMDVAYLRSKVLFAEALTKADSLSTSRTRHNLEHPIYADLQDFRSAYSKLGLLMGDKDSIYIKVQNEDIAILDAEMNNAELRAAAERLRYRNQQTILYGFLLMFAIAFLSIQVSQWRLRENLEQMKKQNNQIIQARRAYQRALDAKEAENALKIKILQNRKSSTIKL